MSKKKPHSKTSQGKRFGKGSYYYEIGKLLKKRKSTTGGKINICFIYYYRTRRKRK